MREPSQAPRTSPHASPLAAEAPAELTAGKGLQVVDGAGAPPGPFRAFLMGGFEGADHRNARGEPLDMNRANGHARNHEGDYRLLRALGIGAARESLGWRLSEPAPGRFDLSRAITAQRSANAAGVQLVWTFMHYGLPDGVSLHDPELVPRFVAFAEAVADALLPLTPGVPVFNLINEISYLSWVASCAVEPDTCDAATRDEVPSAASRRSGARVTQPASSRTSGYLIKRRLVQATLAAMQALHRRDSRIRFLHVEPVVHVVAPRDRPGLRGLARRVRSYQRQVWDMLARRLAPELGGDPAALDLIGVNHYHSGQWEVGTEARLLWHEGDPRRRRLSQLLGEVHARYGRPMIIAETSHFGAGRCAWLDEVAAETKRARDAGLPLEGLCLYPVLDRPDWDDPTHWHHSGLW